MNHSSRSDQRPAFQFYPDDWMAEATLRMCSLPARGLWIDMLCIMFGCHERGVLRKQNSSKSGSKVSSKELAKIVSASEAEVDALLVELENAGVFSKLDDGTIYSRRMVRDEHIRQVRADAGSLGGSSSKRQAKGQQVRKQNLPPPSPSPFPSPSPSPTALTTSPPKTTSPDDPKSAAKSQTGHTVWKAWVDINRELNRTDPVRADPDLKAARVLAGLIPQERLRSVLQAYLADGHDFLTSQGHALRLLGSRVNAYLNPGGTAHGRPQGHVQGLRTDRGSSPDHLRQLRERQARAEVWYTDLPAVPKTDGTGTPSG